MTDAEVRLVNLISKIAQRGTINIIVAASVSIGALAPMILLAFIPIPWTHLGGASYVGLFVASLVSGIIAFAPSPAWGLIYSAAKVLNPTTIALVGGTGLALGEISTYIYGRAVLRNTSPQNSWVAGWSEKINRVMPIPIKWWAPSMFIIALIPTPLFELVSIGAGYLGIPFKRYFIPVYLARLVRAFAIAWAASGVPSW